MYIREFYFGSKHRTLGSIQRYFGCSGRVAESSKIMSIKVESEVLLDSEPCVLAWDGALFVGTENGSIKSYDAKLSPGPSWAAHAVQPFSIDAAGGKVYSASNDGGVKVWSAAGQKICDFPPSAGDIQALHIYGSLVIIGDEVGTVTVFQDNQVKAQYSVLEEIKALQYRQPYLYTARDLYVTVTEITPDESKTRFVTRHTLEGSAPVKVAGDRLLCMARGGNTLKLHSATVEQGFKQLHEVKASDMIITSLAVAGDYVWTGGWDGHVRRWNMSKDQLDLTGDVNLGACVTALAAADDCVYAGLTGGKIVQIRAS